jgi:hypothetical protein
MSTTLNRGGYIDMVDNIGRSFYEKIFNYIGNVLM